MEHTENRLTEVETPARESLPMVALRGLVVFPHTVLNFEAARDVSIKALERAMETDRMVFLAAQRDLRMELPSQEDIYQVGVVARVRHILKLPGDAVRVLIEGLYRAKILEFHQGEYYEVQVENIEEEIPKNERAEAYMRALMERYEEYGSATGNVTQEAIIAISEISSPSKLADTIAVNLMKKTEDKQDILETVDVIERYEKLIRFTDRELNIAAIDREISLRMRKQMEKVQKEHYLREQMRAIQASLGEDERDNEELEQIKKKISALPLPKESVEKLEKEYSRLTRMNSSAPEYNVARTYLEWVTSLPFGEYTEDNLDLERAQRILDEDHYGLKKVKERVIEYLAVCKLKKDMRGPILCFAGPPGVGKTSIAKSIARALGRKFVRMSLGGVKDEAEIRGHRRTYIGAIPGRIVSGVKQAGTMNPLFLLDEIDKMSGDFKGDPASAMLEVLDSEINSEFRDHYLDIEFDLSEVMFVTTANDIGAIPAPLYDRMEVIELSGYTTYEKEQIALRHLIPKQLKENGLTPELLKIDQSALSDMIVGYTGESGVRSLERVIAEACRKGARQYMETGKPVTIRRRNLKKFLGIPRYMDTMVSRENQVGVVNGLAWTSAGGTTLPVEAVAMEGTGKIELTGQLGDVMKESAMTGLSLVRHMAGALQIDEEFYKERDIHVHVPEGAIPKDGPSAGITMALAVTSALTGRKVRCDVAMTGEITLTGRVLPIGGLKEKTLAALRAGIRTIIIPEGNQKDLEEIPRDVKKQVDYRPVASFEQVLELALMEDGA